MNPIAFNVTPARFAASLAGGGFLLLLFTGLGCLAFVGNDGVNIPIALFAIAVDAGVIWLLWRGWRQMRGEPRLVIDDEGVLDRTLHTPRFAWETILSARTEVQRRFGMPMSTTVHLEVSDEAERMAALSDGDRRKMKITNIGMPGFHVNLSGLPISSQRFFALMNERRSLQRLPPIIDGVQTFGR